MADPLRRRCDWCERTLEMWRAGWDPLQSGWRCPDCSRAHDKLVDTLAGWLIEMAPHRRWIGTATHRPFVECLRCDVVRRAEQRVLTRSW